MRRPPKTLLFPIAALSLAMPACALAASPLDEALSAIRSLFAITQPPATRPKRGDPGQMAYADALRLRSNGDSARSIQRLNDAAAAGHAGAAYELGMLHIQGREVARDLDRAAHWINSSADLGDARAQYLVGANLMSGNGVERDPSRGVGFLSRAGKQGHPRAQYLLGQAYVDGVGVAANPAWAARWYGRAARAGHGRAQYAYGVMYGSGLGLPVRPRDAYRWLLLAVKNGQRQAHPLAERIARRLSAQAVAEARAEAGRFVPEMQRGPTDVSTVLFVQYALQRMGYEPGPLDGLMGQRTRSGIRAYESDAGVPASGQITDALLEQLIARTSGTG